MTTNKKTAKRPASRSTEHVIPMEEMGVAKTCGRMAGCWVIGFLGLMLLGLIIGWLFPEKPGTHHSRIGGVGHVR